MNRFPLDKLRVREAELRSALDFNPYSNYPPKQRWTIGLAIDPIVLGSAASYPELETTVDSAIIISDIELRITSWKLLPGTYNFSPASQGGSFYVTNRHNPVDLSRLQVRHVRDNVFALDLDLHFDFEFEGSGYRNDTITLAVEAPYNGFSFIPPVWSQPEEVSFPPDWSVPSTAPKWQHATVRQFVARYVDLSAFGRVVIEDTSEHTTLTATP